MPTQSDTANHYTESMDVQLFAQGSSNNTISEVFVEHEI